MTSGAQGPFYILLSYHSQQVDFCSDNVISIPVSRKEKAQERADLLPLRALLEVAHTALVISRNRVIWPSHLQGKWELMCLFWVANSQLKMGDSINKTERFVIGNK